MLLRDISQYHMLFYAITPFAQLRYSCSTLCMTSYHALSAEYLTVLLTSGMVFDCMVTNTITKTLLLDSGHLLGVVRRLGKDDELRWIQQQVPSRLIVRRDKAEAKETRWIKVRNLVYILNGDPWHEATFPTLKNTILYFSIAFKDEYREKFASTRIIGILETWRGLTFWPKWAPSSVIDTSILSGYYQSIKASFL